MSKIDPKVLEDAFIKALKKMLASGPGTSSPPPRPPKQPQVPSLPQKKTQIPPPTRPPPAPGVPPRPPKQPLDGKIIGMPNPQEWGDVVGTTIAAILVAKLTGVNLAGFKPKTAIPTAAGNIATQLKKASETLTKTHDEAADVAQKLSFNVTKHWDKIQKGIKDSGITLSDFNIKAEEAPKTLAKFLAGSDAFKEAIMKGDKEMANLLGQFVGLSAPVLKAGVGIEELTGILDYAAKEAGGLEGNSEKVIKSFKKLTVSAANTAKIVRSPLSGVFKHFGGILKDYTIWPLEEATKQLREVEIASKLTGFSMEKISSTAKGFDTLEGAGTKIAELGAVLKGSTLDINEMLAATDPERFKLVMQDIETAMEEGRFKLGEGRERYYSLMALEQITGFDKTALDRYFKTHNDGQTSLADSMEKVSTKAKTNIKTFAELVKVTKNAAGATETAARPTVKLANSAALSAEGTKKGVNALQSLSKQMQLFDKTVQKSPGFKTLITGATQLGSSLSALNLILKSFSEKGGTEGLLMQGLFGNFKNTMKIFKETQKTADSIRSLTKEIPKLLQELEAEGAKHTSPEGKENIKEKGEKAIEILKKLMKNPKSFPSLLKEAKGVITQVDSSGKEIRVVLQMNDKQIADAVIPGLTAQVIG